MCHQCSLLPQARLVNFKARAHSNLPGLYNLPVHLILLLAHYNLRVHLNLLPALYKLLPNPSLVKSPHLAKSHLPPNLNHLPSHHKHQVQSHRAHPLQHLRHKVLTSHQTRQRQDPAEQL
jgi:hypothetical protein